MMPTPASGPSVSTHFTAEKVKALCFLKDVASAAADADAQRDLLPLIASGGWDNATTNHIALHVAVLPSRDENALRNEFASRDSAPRPCQLNLVADIEHDGDVNALAFAGQSGDNLLFSASSSGSVYCVRVESAATSDSSKATPLSHVDIPQWKTLFAGSATCLDVSSSGSSLVAAGACGSLAWLALDSGMSVTQIRNNDSSRLRLNAVKMLGRDSVVATVGSAPGSQLRLWDLSANASFPVTTASDAHVGGILTSLEVHPTRPELLITGAEDGRVCFWDQRRLDSPFRTEQQHQHAVRALQLHTAAPRFLFSAGDDNVVNAWDFHYGRRPRDPVVYDPLEAAADSNANGHANAQASCGLQVQPVTSGFLPWNAMALHAESDTLIAGSDAQSILILQNASKLPQQLQRVAY